MPDITKSMQNLKQSFYSLLGIALAILILGGIYIYTDYQTIENAKTNGTKINGQIINIKTTPVVAKGAKPKYSLILTLLTESKTTIHADIGTANSGSNYLFAYDIQSFEAKHPVGSQVIIYKVPNLVTGYHYEFLDFVYNDIKTVIYIAGALEVVILTLCVLYGIKLYKAE